MKDDSYVLQYGPRLGSTHARDSIAKFLSEGYGDEVKGYTSGFIVLLLLPDVHASTHTRAHTQTHTYTSRISFRLLTCNCCSLMTVIT